MVGLASLPDLLAQLAKLPAPDRSRLLAKLSDQDRRALSQHLSQLEAARSALSPVSFARDVFGLQAWSKQGEILESVDRYPRTAVRSGHKVGKSTSAAVLALWWPQRWPDGRVVMTAPTGRQVKNVLWHEIRRLYFAARARGRDLGGEISANPDPGLRWQDGRDVIGFATDEAERIAGFSGAHVLFIVDEGSGVSEEIYEAIEGSRAGGAKLVVLGNPTQNAGTFYEAFRAPKGAWKTVHVSSEQSPNVTGEASVPGLATPEWVAEKRLEWGEGSPLFEIRVRGNFATQSDNAVIGLGLIYSAVERWQEAPAAGRLEIGVDVARFGSDDSVIFPRRGLKALALTVLHGADTVNVAGKVREVALELRETLNGVPERPLVKVDVAGVGGGVADVLRRDDAIEVVEVNAGEASTGDTYSRLRDQLWFCLRDWLKSGGAIPDDGRLQAELAAPTYGFDLRGRMKVEPKDDTKEKLRGRSPDRADALALAVFNRPLLGTEAKYDPPTVLEVQEHPTDLERAIARRVEEIESGR